MFRLSTVGSRTFNVSGPLICNGLPKDCHSFTPQLIVLVTFSCHTNSYLFTYKTVNISDRPELQM